MSRLNPTAEMRTLVITSYFYVFLLCDHVYIQPTVDVAVQFVMIQAIRLVSSLEARS